METTSEFKKNNFFIITFTLLILLIVVIFGFAVYNNKKTNVLQQEKNNSSVLNKISPNEETFENIITETYGIIKEIKGDRIIILGSGSNFEDNTERDITLLFVKETKIDDSETGLRYKGVEGLSHLKEGMVINVVGIGNIKGKTEFGVDSIEKREE